MLALGQTEGLLSELPRGLYHPPIQIKLGQSPQHAKELRAFPHLLAQLPRSGVGLLHFGGRQALGGDQRRAESEVHVQLLLGTLGRVRQRLEQL